MGSSVLIAQSGGSSSPGQPASSEKGEFFFGAGGLKVEGDQKMRPSWTLGATYNAFNKPRLPLLFEYVGAYFKDDGSTYSSASSMEFIGGGLRFGGCDVEGAGGGLFGGVTAGFARIVSNTVVGGQTYSSPAVNKGGVSISGGANIPIGGNSGRQWGLRFEGRGLKLADFNPWIGQFSAGLYLRF